MIFRVSDEVFAKVPDFFVGVIVARGVDNAKTPRESGMAALLAASVGVTLPMLSGKVKEHAKVLPYREAFTKFGINPNKYMCSIEALLSRIRKTGSLPTINSLVDAGNAVSVSHFLPIGAHDLGGSRAPSTVGSPTGLRAGEQAGQQADGRAVELPTLASVASFGECDVVEIRCAQAGDSFTAFGETVPEIVAPGSGFEPGEVVYASGPAVRTRRWMWRQSDLGKITESTRNVFIPIDGFAGFNADEVISARDELAAILRDKFGASVTVGFVDREHPEFHC